MRIISIDNEIEKKLKKGMSLNKAQDKFIEEFVKR